MPTVYIIAGPNGAGKTTFATEFLPDFAECREFLNADLIAAGLSPFAPEAAAMRAGRLLLGRVKELSAQGRDFGFETTLSGRTHMALLREMKRRGYAIHLFFLWLPSVEMAVARVANRVRQGGHPIPEAVIRRRFALGIRNFLTLYCPLSDSWMLFDNSQSQPRLIAREDAGGLYVAQTELYETIKKGAGGIRQ